VHIDRQFRTLDFLPLDELALWILTLQTTRIHPDRQGRISYIKQYLEASVRHAFTQLTGLPETSRQVEDLRELDRLDSALELLEQLGERQTTIETSQDRARLAFRDLAELVRSVQTRVQALEAQAKLRLSTTQRGTIYQLVQTWGNARVERQKDQRSGEAIRACWRLFNQRFGISTYTDLPAAQYNDAIQFIKEPYRSLTGKEIDAVEQSGLDLE
jgi:ORF6C domain